MAQLADAGVRAIDVLPIFLGVGKHLREDLPRLLEDLRHDRPQIAFTLRPVVGESAELIELLAKMALKM
ncbi:CbiX [compost metagenome]